MLRAVGIRYVAVHHGDYTRDERRDREEERSIELLRNSGQVVTERQVVGARVLVESRELRIDVANQDGVTRTLYSASPYPELITAFVRDGFYPRVTFTSADNRSVRLRIRQTASLPSRRWRSIHELRLWKR